VPRALDDCSTGGCVEAHESQAGAVASVLALAVPPALQPRWLAGVTTMVNMSIGVLLITTPTDIASGLSRDSSLGGLSSRDSCGGPVVALCQAQRWIGTFSPVPGGRSLSPGGRSFPGRKSRFSRIQTVGSRVHAVGLGESGDRAARRPAKSLATSPGCGCSRIRAFVFRVFSRASPCARS